MRLHLRPATAAPKRNASASLRPSASASAKPPCSASPAPSVSTARISNTGTAAERAVLEIRMSFGPLLTARKASVCRAIGSSPSARSLAPVVAVRHSEENTTWVAMRKQRIVGHRRLCRRRVRPGRLRRRAASQIGCGRIADIGCRRAPDRPPATIASGSIAAQRPRSACRDMSRSCGRPAHRRKSPTAPVASPSTRWHALVSTLSRASAASTRSPLSSLPGRAAKRARQHRPAAETRDRNGGVRRAAAVDDEKVLWPRPCVSGLRKLFDAKHLVEHEDAGAQDARRARVLSRPRRHHPRTDDTSSGRARRNRG